MPDCAPEDFSPEQQHLIAAGRIFLLAATACEQGRLAEAEQLYGRVLEMVPDHPPSSQAIGLIRAHLGDPAGAIARFRAALEKQPDLVAARYNLGVLLQQSGDPGAAQCFAAVLEYAPAHAPARLGLANTLEAEGRPNAAIARLREALAIDPSFVPAQATLGRMLAARGAFAEALAYCQQVVAHRSNSADAHFNLGTVAKSLGRAALAERHMRTAIQLDAGHVRAHINLGNLRKEQNDFDMATACYETAVAISPNCGEALNNLGHQRYEQGRTDEASALHGRALTANPGDAHARVAHCVSAIAIVHRDEAEIVRRRQDYADRLNALATYAAAAGPAALADGIGASQPFYLPYQALNDRPLQEIYGRLVCAAMAARFPDKPQFPPPPATGERIRVGIVSGFFRDHSNWKVPIKGWLTGLDRSRFALFCYHTGVRCDSETAAARRLCPHFVQGPFPLPRWRETILADRPHVLIYPEVGIDPIALQLAAQRLAPVQCNSWGQPVTSGMPTFDYFLSSDLMEPEGAEAHYTERLVRLPGLSIHYDEERDRVPRAEARARFGLPPDSVVFWCGQSLFKFLPRHDTVFPSIAREVGDCRFLFIRHRYGDHVNRVFQDRLAAAFAAHGLRAEDHCVMLPHMARPDFVASQAAADVFLDSIEWSGCNTLLESLSHALPAVTVAGAFMRGRHATAILRQLGVPELVCENVAEYRDTAVRLARDVAWRDAIRKRIFAGKDRILRDQAPVTALENFLEKVA
ncbi:MAG TPA: tetratricopeptide repeat protein [Acetobacteraceae bacterium]|nr:tetratricopeptide repeat protein [Acetobacteraceae bacterium]